MGRARARRTTVVVSALLALAVSCVFARVAGHQFLAYDDTEYVTANPEVRSGLTLHGTAWAFTSTHAYNWHPLTWISHMLDVQLFGLQPAGHHLTSVFLHAADTVLLFLVLGRLTRSTWRSALAAALFGVHPLHVESVAWIAERKDVLSAFFLMATLFFYSRWMERGGRKRYLLIVAAYAAGLAAKPMLVTLPILLLFLDFWPLQTRRPFRVRLRDKLPLFAMASASSCVTVWAQQRGGAVKTLEAFPFSARLANAVVSTVRYLELAVWPRGLAAFYPHPGSSLPALRIASAAAVLVLLTVAAVVQRKRAPYVAFGWGWYVVSLLPVIGLVQIGDQGMADRYTYIPLIGPFVAASWGLADLSGRWPVLAGSPRRVPILGLAGCALVAALGSVAWVQAGYWRDTTTLFAHAIRVTPENARVHQLQGDGFTVRGDFEHAASEYRNALRIRPDDAPVMTTLGSLYLRQRRLDEAIALFRQALRLDPANATAHNNLGLALDAQGDRDGAASEFAAALAIRTNDAGAHYNLGNVLLEQRNVPDAIVHFRKALALDPDMSDAYRTLAWSLYFVGDNAGAREQVRVGRRHGFKPPQDLLDRLAQAAPDTTRSIP